MTENDVIDFLVKYSLTKTLDGVGGKDITAWIEAVKSGGKERLENLVIILHRRREKAEVQSKEVSFEISPRIAERIMNEGCYSSEAVMQDYYAGILLSTQDDPFSDAGVFYLSTIQRLSSLQIRAHYIVYQMLKEAYHKTGSVRNLRNSDPTTGLTYVLANDFLYALYNEENKVNEREEINDQFDQFVDHIDLVLQGLRKENLIKTFFTVIDSEEENPNISPYFIEDRQNNRIRDRRQCYYFFSPTSEGIQLFMWGQGYGNLPTNEFLNDKVAIMPPLFGINVPKAIIYSNHDSLFKYSDILEFAKRKFDNE